MSPMVAPGSMVMSNAMNQISGPATPMTPMTPYSADPGILPQLQYMIFFAYIFN